MSTKPAWLNPALWVVAVMVVNVAWLFVTEQEAPIELNKEGQLESFRTFDLEGALSSNEPMPTRLLMAFSTDSPEDVNLTYALRLDNQTIVTQWNGTVAQAPDRWEGDLAPGRYVLETQVSRDVDVEQTLFVTPFKPVQVLGHLALSVGLVLLALAEQGVKELYRRRAVVRPPSTTSERSPFKPLNQGMPDADQQVQDESPWRDPMR